MRIAAGPPLQASLSRQAIWWRGCGDPPFKLAHTASDSAANCVATSPSTGGGSFGMISFAVDVPRPAFLRIDVEMPGRIARIGRMIKRTVFAALVFAAPACLVLAQDTRISVDMVGIGGMSCAHWRATQAHRLEGTIWVYGFWTGLNYVAAASDQAQAKIDAAAIVNEVERTCAQRSSQTLATATWTAYLGSKK